VSELTKEKGNIKGLSTRLNQGDQASTPHLLCHLREKPRGNGNDPEEYPEKGKGGKREKLAIKDS